MNQANHYERPESEVFLCVSEKSICSVGANNVEVTDPWAANEGDGEEEW